MIGEVETVSAALGKFGSHSIGEDAATLSLQFAGGCMGLLDMSWCAPADLARAEWALNETVVVGTAGTLRLLTDGSLEWIGPTGSRERRPVILPPDYQVCIDGYVATQQHFVSGLITGAEHETQATDTLRTMDVVWTAYRPAEEGRTFDGMKDNHKSSSPPEPLTASRRPETCHHPGGSIG